MSYEVYHDPYSKMITIVQTHENLSDVNPLNSHHYFWLMKDELERLRHIKNKFSAYLKLHRG